MSHRKLSCRVMDRERRLISKRKFIRLTSVEHFSVVPIHQLVRDGRRVFIPVTMLLELASLDGWDLIAHAAWVDAVYGHRPVSDPRYPPAEIRTAKFYKAHVEPGMFG